MNRTLSREEQIFLAAVELESADERQAFIERSCSDNSELRNRVVKRIEQHVQQDSFLDKTSDSFLNQLANDNDPISAGVEIGPYKLLQKIGAGGMGVVFMAEQTEPIRRKVAVKVIRLGLDSKNVIARFEAERQALSIMDHLNITKVYDAGVTECGRPYFVMELITGSTITDYCDQRKLNLRQRIELFYKVCNALQHAHQKGVIHRDIKPSNVLVTHRDGVSIPKIIDFGIAKAIDRPLTDLTLFTSYGNIVGTPEYMSPEQAEMSGQDIDTCSDVYSLGVLLYELMTGTTPFYRHKGTGLRKICDAICTEEPDLASTRVNNIGGTIDKVSNYRNVDPHGLKHFLRGDIDWILTKCLAKKRENRYATAADLASDIQRYLHGEPILAAAPSNGYRLKKFISRHRLSVSAAAVIAASLLVTTLVSFAFAARAMNAERLAQRHLQDRLQAQFDAELERDRALAAEAKLRELERSSRREAANAQAIVKFVNQVAAGQSSSMVGPPPESCAVEAASSGPTQTEPTLTKTSLTKMIEMETAAGDTAQTQSARIRNSTPFAVSIGTDGKMVVRSADGKFEFEFAGPVSGDCNNATQASCIKYKAVGEENRKYAERVLCLVSEEMQNKFGSGDLFVVEPKMLLANMQVENKNWVAAEQHLREVKDILKNNVSDEALQCKNTIMLAMALAKQNKKDEARQLIERHIDELRRNPQVREALNQAFSEIRSAVADVQDEFGVDIDVLADKFSDLGDGMTDKVFDLLEDAIDKSKTTESADKDELGMN